MCEVTEAASPYSDEQWSLLYRRRRKLQAFSGHMVLDLHPNLNSPKIYFKKRLDSVLGISRKCPEKAHILTYFRNMPFGHLLKQHKGPGNKVTGALDIEHSSPRDAINQCVFKELYRRGKR